MKNKKVLILGASSDIGISTVNYFLKNDWYVIAHYNKNKKSFARVSAELTVKHFVSKTISHNRSDCTHCHGFIGS